MKRVSWTMFLVLALMLAMASQRPAHAGMINGSVSLDTSGLSGTFELAFIFIDGSGTGDANNTVTLNNFLFGGGSAGVVDAALSTGGVSGDLTSGPSLVDTSFFNVFASSFTPGSVVSFDFSLTTNVDPGGTPDQLSLALLQTDGTPVVTEDPSGVDSLVTVNIDSANPVFSAFASDLTPAPVVRKSNPAPEPQSLLLFAASVAGALWSARRARRKSSERQLSAIKKDGSGSEADAGMSAIGQLRSLRYHVCLRPRPGLAARPSGIR